MKTEEALEGLTDPGRFEILAIRVLRNLHPECQSLAHIGVNAGGKTIPNPVDAFALVPGSRPPRYIFAAFTLAGRKALRLKWLYEPVTSPKGTARNREVGDLVKAGREAARLRLVAPDAEFAVYLCTNRRLDQALMDAVYRTARTQSIQVVFLELSRLRDYLDGASGQALREDFLAIAAREVSRDLILKLSQNSLQEYRNEAFEDGQAVATAAGRDARSGLTSVAPIGLLVGRPGAGKSVVARTLLQDQIGQGEMGLWVPTHILQRAMSLAEAVHLALKQFNPNLGDDAGHEALALATSEHPLLLILDDANRADAPERTISRLLGWGRNLFPPQENRESARIKLIVPIWEAYWSSLRRQYEASPWLRTHSVGPMLREESILCLRNRLNPNASGVTTSDLDHIAGRLKDDPILLSIFARLARENPGARFEPILADTIGSFVTNSLAHLRLEEGALEASYRSSLLRLTQKMLVKKSLHPGWAELQEWFAEDAFTLRHLEGIAAHADVCGVVKRGTRDVFEFRHDRILEHQLSEAIAALIRDGDAGIELIFDPFLTQITGRALTIDEVSDHVLDLAAALLPSCLVAALAFLPSSETGAAKRLCQRARAWLGSAGNVPRSIREDAFQMLANTDSPHALHVTEEVASAPDARCARLRNGDAFAGAAALSDEFYPSTKYAWLESLISQARARHGAELTRQLHVLLTDPVTPEEIRAGALVLAGYLGDISLEKSVLAGWRFLAGSHKFVLSAVWAALRCCADDSPELLDTVLPAVFTVPDERGPGGWSERRQLFEDLAFAASHGFRPFVLTQLRELATNDKRYSDFVFSLFQEIDDPVALEFVIRRVAKKAAEPAREGMLSGAFVWETQWRRGEGFGYRPLSCACVEALERLWEPHNPEWLRKFAFKLWIRFSGEALWVTELPGDLAESDEAVSERAQRGDRRVIGSVLQRAAIAAHWCQFVRYIWAEDFESVIDTALKRGTGGQFTCSGMFPG